MENQIKIILKYFNLGLYNKVIKETKNLQKKFTSSSYLDLLIQKLETLRMQRLALSHH